MKKPSNIIRNLRYICLVGVIALGLMTIVGTSGTGTTVVLVALAVLLGTGCASNRGQKRAVPRPILITVPVKGISHA
jgi:DNA repair ATPase RecN